MNQKPKMEHNEAKVFVKERDEWRDYSTIEEYIEDVTTCLVYSSWRYSEEHAREIIDYKMVWVKYGFEHQIPANDCSAEVGFFAG